MKNLPMYKRMQGRTLDEEFGKQNAVFEFYSEQGIVNGAPGIVSEQDMDSMCDAITKSDMPRDVKLSALEVLDVYAQNNLEFGNASNSIEGIHSAWRNVFYGSQLEDGSTCE